MASIKERLLEKSLLVMTLFGPWIWEEIENRLNFALIKHKFNTLTTSAKIFKILMLKFVEFLCECKAALKTVIKTDEIDMRVFLTVLHHEFAVTGSNFHFNGIGSRELRIPFSYIGFRFFITQHE